jgi:hypothetical protein
MLLAGLTEQRQPPGERMPPGHGRRRRPSHPGETGTGGMNGHPPRGDSESERREAEETWDQSDTRSAFEGD